MPPLVARAAVVRDAGEGRRARVVRCRRAARRSARRCPRSTTSRTSRDYMTVLITITSQAQPREQREAGAAGMDPTSPTQSAIAHRPHRRRGELSCDAPSPRLRRQHGARSSRSGTCSCARPLDAAFPHQTGEQTDRTLDIDGRRRSVHAQHRLSDVGDLHRTAGDGIPRRPQLLRPSARLASDRPVPRGPHDPALRGAAGARWHAVQAPPAFA